MPGNVYHGSQSHSTTNRPISSKDGNHRLKASQASVQLSGILCPPHIITTQNFWSEGKSSSEHRSRSSSDTMFGITVFIRTLLNQTRSWISCSGSLRPPQFLRNCTSSSTSPWLSSNQKPMKLITTCVTLEGRTDPRLANRKPGLPIV